MEDGFVKSDDDGIIEFVVEDDETDDQEIVGEDGNPVQVPVENGPWEDSEDFFERYLY